MGSVIGGPLQQSLWKGTLTGVIGSIPMIVISLTHKATHHYSNRKHMSADVKELGTLAPHISYVRSSRGTTYNVYTEGKQMSITLIRTAGRVEYTDVANLPLYPSPRLRMDLSRIAKHFTKQRQSNG